MTADRSLVLPSPARELWLQSRDAVRAGLERIQRHEADYALTGGTVLAARWRHRESFDIDILVPADTPLYRVAGPDGDDFRRRMTALGGTARYSRELNKLKVSFPHGGHIDLWAKRPIYGSATKVETVEGRKEAVLSNGQILRGKLERGQMNLARDVYDVLRARERDPLALEAAVNAMPRPVAEDLAWSWHRANASIRDDAEVALQPTEGFGVEDRSLGTRAAGALHASLYEHLAISVSKGLIVVETVTTAETRRTRRMSPADVDRRFEECGLNLHFANKQPDAVTLRDRAKTLAGEAAGTTVFYREERDAAVHYEPMSKAGPSH